MKNNLFVVENLLKKWILALATTNKEKFTIVNVNFSLRFGTFFFINGAKAKIRFFFNWYLMIIIISSTN